jgi:hypothetical protein
MKIIRVLLLVLLLSSLSGCTRAFSYQQLSAFTQLEFRPDSLYSSDYQGKSPSIYVITDNTSIIPEWFGSSLQRRIERVDLTPALVIVALRGVTDYKDNWIIITDVWQKARTIYVRAQIVSMPDNINTPKYQSSRCHAVFIKKDEITGQGKFTFVLLDDYGNLIATTSAIIQSGKNK